MGILTSLFRPKPQERRAVIEINWVADREGRQFKRLNELYAATGQVGFLASERVDGKLILAEAVQVMAMKA